MEYTDPLVILAPKMAILYVFSLVEPPAEGGVRVTPSEGSEGCRMFDLQSPTKSVC